MIEVIYGNDREKVSTTLKEILSRVNKQYPGILKYNLDDISFSPDTFSQYFSSSQLFGEQKIQLLVCKDVLEKKENERWVTEKVDEISNSKNVVIFVERAISKEFLELCKKQKINIHTHTLVKKDVPEFNIFSLTDMFGARKRKEAWITFQKALREGVTPEMILWKLQWQLKTMVLARSAKSDKEAGLHPFVYQKARGYANGFSETEINSLSQNLIKIYEDDRAGRREMEFGLELMLLSL